MKEKSLEWRRSKVIELILQVSLGTVNRDLSIIRQQARKNLEIHIQEKLPEEYQRCLTGLNQVLKTCWYIVNKSGTDDKTKLQATAIINESYKYVMDLVTNGSVITDAIKHVTHIQNDVSILNKCDKSLDAIEEEITTNGVF